VDGEFHVGIPNLLDGDDSDDDGDDDMEMEDHIDLSLVPDEDDEDPFTLDMTCDQQVNVVVEAVVHTEKYARNNCQWCSLSSDNVRKGKRNARKWGRFLMLDPKIKSMSYFPLIM